MHHHGVVTRRAEDVPPLLHDANLGPEGVRVGPVYGTHWHGVFECDAFRRAFLTEVAALAGRHGFVVAPDTRFGAARERMVDVLGDLVEAHLDTDALWRLIASGPPAGLPLVCTRLDAAEAPLGSAP